MAARNRRGLDLPRRPPRQPKPPKVLRITRIDDEFVHTGDNNRVAFTVARSKWETVNVVYTTGAFTAHQWGNDVCVDHRLTFGARPLIVGVTTFSEAVTVVCAGWEALVVPTNGGDVADPLGSFLARNYVEVYDLERVRGLLAEVPIDGMPQVGAEVPPRFLESIGEKLKCSVPPMPADSWSGSPSDEGSVMCAVFRTFLLRLFVEEILLLRRRYI